MNSKLLGGGVWVGAVVAYALVRPSLPPEDAVFHASWTPYVLISTFALGVPLMITGTIEYIKKVWGLKP